MIGHFVDAAWAYKFGPPAPDAIVVTLEQGAGGNKESAGGRESAGAGSAGGKESAGASILSQAMRFPAGRPLERESPERLGLAAQAEALPDGTVRLALSSRRLAYGVEIHAPGFVASDDGFSIEPGGERVVRLLPQTVDATFVGGALTAVNLPGQVPIACKEQDQAVTPSTMRDASV